MSGGMRGGRGMGVGSWPRGVCGGLFMTGEARLKKWGSFLYLGDDNAVVRLMAMLLMLLMMLLLLLLLPASCCVT